MIELGTVDAIFETLRLSNVSMFGEAPISQWLFRGHASVDWRLVPVVWRTSFLTTYRWPNPLIANLAAEAAQKYPSRLPNRDRLAESIERLLVEYSLYRDFALLASDLALIDDVGQLPHLTEVLQPDASDFLKRSPCFLATVAQHYGVPTRLLDWSRDPLTALFFALEEPTSGTDLLVWAFDAGAYQNHQRINRAGATDPHVDVYFGSGRSNDYLRAQRGAFTFVSGGESRFLQSGEYPTVDSLVPKHLMKQFRVVISPQEKILATVRLIRERRTRAHLMPDLGSCAHVAISNLKMGVHL